MNRTVAPLLWILFAVFTASAQDVITVGTGSAPAGGVASVPVYVLDRSGTPLGSDAGTGGEACFALLSGASAASS